MSDLPINKHHCKHGEPPGYTCAHCMQDRIEDLEDKVEGLGLKVNEVEAGREAIRRKWVEANAGTNRVRKLIRYRSEGWAQQVRMALDGEPEFSPSAHGMLTQSDVDYIANALFPPDIGVRSRTVLRAALVQCVRLVADDLLPGDVSLQAAILETFHTAMTAWDDK